MQYPVTRRSLGLLFLAAASACAPQTLEATSRVNEPTVMTNTPVSRYAADSGAVAVTPVVSSAAAGGGSTPPVLLPAPVVAGSPAAGSGGVGGAVAAADCGAIRQKAESKPRPVDIVWIIDGSGSMADEQAAVKQNIASFATAIGSAGIDHHVVMVAKDDVAAGTPLGTDPAHYTHVRASVGSHDALSVLLATYAQYAPFLRAEASLHFVVVTDDESSMKADDFRAQMQQKTGKTFTAHSIVSESVDGRACVGACGISLLCGAASPGLQYLALSDATSGQKISICLSDWSMVFGPLKTAVIASAPLPCDYPLPKAPAGSSLDPNRVNVGVLLGTAASKTLPRAAGEQACASAEAWFYDDPSAPTMIRMCPAACSGISTGGAIEITLGCETISLN
jgi:hypothetical protein